MWNSDKTKEKNQQGKKQLELLQAKAMSAKWLTSATTL